MDQQLKDDWAKAMESLLEMESDKRKHFALLVLYLAKCYADKENWQAVVLVNNEDALLTFSVGADEAKAVALLQMANEAVLMAATDGAPPKEMFN